MSLRSFTLHDQIERNARLHAARTAYVAGQDRPTHAGYAARVARLAAGLAAAGVGVGDRVAVLAQNSGLFIDLLGAVARLGAILVPVNWRLSAEEAGFVLSDTTPVVLLADPALQPLVAGAALEGVRRFSTGEAGEGWLAAAGLYLDTPAPPPADIADEAGLIIVHTAAVSGRPRGALLSHRGLLTAAAHTAAAWRLTAEDVHVAVLPLFHIAAVGMLLAVQAAGGSTVVLPRFEAARVVEVIDAARGSVMGSFSPMLAGLLDAAAAAGSTLASLRVVNGMEKPEALARFAQACPHASFWVSFGQTETSGGVTRGRYADRPGSAGRPIEQTAIVIVDEEDRPLPPGGTGEIVVRGPLVFLGYWNRPDDNRTTFRNGWHHTGDLGRFDADGYLWYVGRSAAKELIKPGGENVYPAEVERVLCEHPAVAAAVVFGVPDSEWGEAVRAVCALHPGATVSEQALIEFVGQRIARFKKPKRVVLTDALPRRPDGGPDRAAVKAAHGG